MFRRADGRLYVLENHPVSLELFCHWPQLLRKKSYYLHLINLEMDLSWDTANHSIEFGILGLECHIRWVVETQRSRAHWVEMRKRIDDSHAHPETLISSEEMSKRLGLDDLPKDKTRFDWYFFCEWIQFIHPRHWNWWHFTAIKAEFSSSDSHVGLGGFVAELTYFGKT